MLFLLMLEEVVWVFLSRLEDATREEDIHGAIVMDFLLGS